MAQVTEILSRFYSTKDLLAQCNICGKQANLSTCANYNSVSYCGRECQKKGWKSHKKECASLAGEYRNRPCVRAKLCKPGQKLPTKPCVISEVPGIGSVTVGWMAGQAPNTLILKEDVFNLSNQARKIEFNHFDDLDPVNRFVITCGPLNDLNTAKSSLSDALSMVRGDLSKLRAPAAGSQLWNELPRRVTGTRWSGS